MGASTTALNAAEGDFVTMLDHDDVLVPDALARLSAALVDRRDAVFAYSDNALLRADGRVVEPFYKPDFSPERLRNHNYVLHCVMARLDAYILVAEEGKTKQREIHDAVGLLGEARLAGVILNKYRGGVVSEGYGIDDYYALGYGQVEPTAK